MSNHSVQTVSTSNDKYKVILAVAAMLIGIAAFYILAGQSTLIRVAALLAGLLVAVGLVAISDMGKNFVEFAKESVRETKKVVWPTRKEATQITAVVFGFVLVMAIFLWGADKLLEFVLYDVILGWKK
ncbi:MULTISPECIES: preprotein translocase subunit SecE [unclassified Undibacterium]|uniref:preprotein translocase subunit SecE n=1 Tax=unclassified Undibacterium TaxID=2630295 RepID=UPI002AC96C5E|nr:MULTISPECIES: preprotein translocase subunit SecE [unclassified Undibacterium]MEB0137420.1 preprotein translocase subunit SecE [Undibacterium sp. CCC2.1]MEB0170915.1 preprotein translocase subunit SecE [Undibacterium sp. CCC1.1]MEB0174867.1 preprotein translocase subunit SecE [Undibacterium sp. CCC3.4]MEB0214203.1 preprotein translocase subunit SecE [Undibacterium sp. 5I2]WPX44514.1 preprotein translocase subunit SecE [Undibacterium sp. CCC3.4]